MSASVIPTVEQLAIIGTLKTSAATGKIKLIKSTIALTPGITAADLAAIEADFSGYAAITLTTLPSPYADPSGGVTFPVPTVEFVATTATPFIGNDIWGGWVEDSTGLLLWAFVLGAAYGMQAVGNTLPLTQFRNLFGPSQLSVFIGSVPQ